MMLLHLLTNSTSPVQIGSSTSFYFFLFQPRIDTPPVFDPSLQLSILLLSVAAIQQLTPCHLHMINKTTNRRRRRRAARDPGRAQDAADASRSAESAMRHTQSVRDVSALVSNASMNRGTYGRRQDWLSRLLSLSHRVLCHAPVGTGLPAPNF